MKLTSVKALEMLNNEEKKVVIINGLNTQNV